MEYLHIVQKFLQVKNNRELADILGLTYSKLIYSLRLVKKSNLSKRYIDFEVPKKNGGKRLISAPNKLLLLIQRRLVKILSYIYLPPKCVHGFVKKINNNSRFNKTIISNAKAHVNQKVILNIDLKDFFPSINSKRIFNLFTKPPFNFNKKVAGLITEICIHETLRHLPQGAATSPILSNMICLRMDKKLTKLAKEYRIIYTRYADDITFSSSKENIDDKLLEKICEIIKEEGFEINKQKIRIQKKVCDKRLLV